MELSAWNGFMKPKVATVEALEAAVSVTVQAESGDVASCVNLHIAAICGIEDSADSGIASPLSKLLSSMMHV
ncbi:hypothetical protein J6590_027221 [Homalodisca vitripennis]|nr:hypothetical protein J6590_027221 [Homalodisca vitripennis]